MRPLSGTSALIPLPEFPQGLGVEASAGAVGLRRFGVLESDLDVDFNSANRAALATHLLESCTVDPTGALSEGFFRDLSIGKRIECLLVLAAGGREAALGFPFQCAGCGEEIELELTLREISEMQHGADLTEIVGVDIGGRRIDLRKPTGRDQEEWSGIKFINERDAARGMITKLAEWPFPLEALHPEALSTVEEVLEAADPLINFSCSVSCGECGELNEQEIDLMKTALDRLNRAQNQLIVEVHRLASHYHWSEQEIFALPDRRRHQYLALVGAMKK